jgi:hypothetical protein
VGCPNRGTTTLARASDGSFLYAPQYYTFIGLTHLHPLAPAIGRLARKADSGRNGKLALVCFSREHDYRYIIRHRP